ncbi:hypothetical protein ACFLZV_03420 [Candidatus Margulisiibacteriota bacterium]
MTDILGNISFLFENIPFVDILNTGLAGFCFLIALFGYLLLRHEQRKSVPNRNILKSIESFIKKTLFLGILVGLCLVTLAFVEQKANVTDIASVSTFTESLPEPVRSSSPSASKRKIEEAISRLGKITDLEKYINELVSQNAKLTAELSGKESLELNFFVKIAILNSKINEFGGTSINPFYPFDEQKRKVNIMIQDLLAELNHYAGPVDGDRYKTQEALIEYQKEKGFTKLGFFAFPTIKAMLEEYLKNSSFKEVPST